MFISSLDYLFENENVCLDSLLYIFRISFSAKVCSIKKLLLFDLLYIWIFVFVVLFCIPKLQPLVDYVLELEKGLKEKHCSFGQEIWTHFDGFSADKSGKELVTAKSLPYLHKMLRALKEDDHAKEMSRPYFETDDPF